MNDMMALFAVYSPNILGIIIICTLLVGNLWRLSDRTYDNRALLAMLVITLAACIADPVAYTFDGRPGILAFILVYVSNFWLYLANLLCTFSWIVFLSIHVNGRLYKKNTILMMVISGIGFVTLIINFFVPLVFDVDSSNVYSRGPLYFMFAGIGLIFLLDSVWIYMKSRNSTAFHKFFPIWIFILPVVTGVAIQSAVYGFSLVWASAAVAITGIFVALQNETIFKDNLTGLYSRSYFDVILSRRQYFKSQQVSGIMLDINRFKSINDIYGHHEGDLALRKTADLLRKAIGEEGAIIRYAGDEFVVLLNTHDNAEIKKAIESIRSCTEDYNSNSGKPYEITLSIGYHKMYLDTESINDFMNEVDKKMYEDKSSFYENNPEYDRRMNIDSLTGLYTKRAFYSKARKLINNNPDSVFSLIISDIENFKAINMNYGEAMGDELLRHVGMHLAEQNSEDSIFARYSGDQFVCLLKAVDVHNLDDIEEIRQTVNAIYNEAPVDKFVIKFGIYANVDHDLPISIMCDRALLAVRSIKHLYHNDIALYNEKMKIKQSKELQIAEDMQDAIANNEFKVFYQPKHNLATGRVVGSEALIRWQHPEHGFMRPDEFIPIFEKTGFISRMDEFVWLTACKVQKERLESGLPVIPISINVSRRDLFHKDFHKVISGALKQYDIDGSLFHMELTESIYVEDAEKLKPVIQSIRDLGIKVELDDFGSGFSSLGMLNKLPLDVIKLDRSFINDLEEQRVVVESVIELAHKLGYSIIAEGVETEEQVLILREMGCDCVQGFYYSPPLEPLQFVEYVIKTEQEFK